MKSEVLDLHEVGITFLVLLKHRSASDTIPAYAFVLVDAHLINTLIWLLLVCYLIKVYLTWRFRHIRLLLFILEVYVP